MYSYLSPSIRKSLLLVWLSSIWTLSTVVTHIYLSVTHPFSCIREHQEHHDILKDISRFPGFVNVQTYRTSRIGSLDVFFRDCLPSVNQAPLDPNFFSTPTPMWKSVKILWLFVPSCALMAHGVSHCRFLWHGHRPQMCHNHAGLSQRLSRMQTRQRVDHSSPWIWPRCCWLSDHQSRSTSGLMRTSSGTNKEFLFWGSNNQFLCKHQGL